jgi:hypothetical protein
MRNTTNALRILAACAAVVLLGAGQPPAPPPGTTPALPQIDLPQPVPPTVAPPLAPVPSVPSPPPLPQPIPAPPMPNLRFTIDPKAPTRDLLPVAPKAAARGPVTTNDLAAVPELAFAEAPTKPDAMKQMSAAAHQIAKINAANAAGKKSDAFMVALLDARPDLAGMPFNMGDACRTSGKKLQHFNAAVSLVRAALNGGNSRVSVVPAAGQAPLAPFVSQPVQQAPVALPEPVLPQPAAPQTVVPQVAFFSTGDVNTSIILGELPTFWKQFATLCEQNDKNQRMDAETAEHITVARVSALMQMLAAEAPEMRLGLVKYLTAVPHAEATKALARLAVYSVETDIRAGAVTALKVRREKDYTDVLVNALRYPWPAVAKNAADAITKLERTDLVPELLAVLDSADPRLPVAKGDTKALAVKELVKVNHHRNCLMCHAPNGSGTPNEDAITAQVAVPGQQLPSPSQGGYRSDIPELLIRLDVTYLRQDFSVSLPVKEAHPWPSNQRFDFFVRERVLSADEAEEFRTKLAQKEAGVLSPYHKAAVGALRELTGKDAAPTAEAWRKLLATK